MSESLARGGARAKELRGLRREGNLAARMTSAQTWILNSNERLQSEKIRNSNMYRVETSMYWTIENCDDWYSFNIIVEVQ